MHENVSKKIKFPSKNKKIAAVFAAVVVLSIASVLLVTNVIIPSINYNKAVEMMDAGNYEEAIASFARMDGYKDSDDKIRECKYRDAVSLMESGAYEQAIEAFGKLPEYKDSQSKIEECQIGLQEEQYNHAVSLMDAGNYEEAIAAFEAIKDFKDSADKIEECEEKWRVEKQNEADYQEAISLINVDNAKAYELFDSLQGYKDSEEYCSRFKFLITSVMESGDCTTYSYEFSDSGELKSMTVLYSDSYRKTLYFNENLEITEMTGSLGRYSDFEYMRDSEGNLYRFTYKFHYRIYGKTDPESCFEYICDYKDGQLIQRATYWLDHGPSGESSRWSEHWSDYRVTYGDNNCITQIIRIGDPTKTYTYEVYYGVSAGSMEIPAYEVIYFMEI